ncbi:MAG: AAA family ATPase, partial [Candidatus Lokiarchaeota archaeon]|nr:AAA family ATPase [Candidatus Lokiarchaeota archaeon]
MNIFDSLLEKNTIFTDESKLDMNYIPEKLPHREKELKILSHLFVILLKRPNSISRKILITGKTGIGKTVTLKYFGELLRKAMKSKNTNLKYIHVNCRKQRTSYKTLVMIVRAIDKSVPKRGYSLQDLLDILIDLINGQDTHLLVVLDELNYIIEKDEDLLYYLTRINDDSLKNPQRLSIIGVVRDVSCLNNLDQSTLSTLQRNIIKFNNYDKTQIFDILKYRAGLSFKHNVISNELIEVVSEVVYGKGDIRFGLNLLWKAGKIAEGQGLKEITTECIRQANQDSFFFVPVDLIEDIPEKRLVFLLAIVIMLEKKRKPY